MTEDGAASDRLLPATSLGTLSESGRLYSSRRGANVIEDVVFLMDLHRRAFEADPVDDREEIDSIYRKLNDAYAKRSRPPNHSSLPNATREKSSAKKDKDMRDTRSNAEDSESDGESSNVIRAVTLTQFGEQPEAEVELRTLAPDLRGWIDTLVTPPSDGEKWIKAEVPSNWRNRTELLQKTTWRCGRTCRYHHFQKLLEIWRNSEFETNLHLVIDHIGPRSLLLFLNALCVRIPSDVIADPMLYHDPSLPVTLVHADKMCDIGDADKTCSGKFHVTLQNAVEDMWSDHFKPPSESERRPFRRIVNFMKKARSDRHMSVVSIYYTEATAFFSSTADSKDNNEDLSFLNLQQAITNTTGKYDDHYSTPIGQAITSNNWDLAFPQFVWQRCFDAVFLYVTCWYLTPLSHSVYEQCAPQFPDWHWILLLGFIGVRSFIQMLAELGVCFCFLCSGKKESRNRWNIATSYQNPYSVFMVLVETCSFLWVCSVLRDFWIVHGDDFLHPSDYSCGDSQYAKKWEHTWVKAHPGVLASVVFLKWIQAMLSVMNFNVLLPNLLPAWTAITSRESMVFLMYLVTLTCGTMLAYYSLPSEESAGPSTYFSDLVRMFRLDFFADFDDDDLEGAINIVNNTTYPWEIQQANQSVVTHNTLKMFTMAFSLMFPVVLLNMYVGLLSEAYERCQRHVIHVCGVYLSAVTCRLLLYRHFWRTYAPWFSLDGLRVLFDGGDQVASWPVGGVWIMIPEDRLAADDSLMLKRMERKLLALAQDRKDGGTKKATRMKTGTPSSSA